MTEQATNSPKLLWHSNAPQVATGYGQQTALFLPKLKDAYDLACSCFYGIEGHIAAWRGIPLLPAIGTDHGNETIRAHASMFFDGDDTDGLVVTLSDVWIYNPAIWSRLNVASWCPVDHEPAPDPVVDYFRASGAVPIAMSRFGERELREAGLDPLYVPHGVDTAAYRPVDDARAQTEMPEDAFIVGMVAANKGNPSRKGFPEAFSAFAALREQHADAMLYLHTEATGRYSDGVNLPDLAERCGIPKEALLYCDQYRAVHFPFPPERMAAVYSSLDVLLMPSYGEGFGIPTVEAQACGVPVIVSDFSAQPELVGAGWKVSGERHFTPIKSWQIRPDPADILESLRLAYALSDAERAKAAREAREFALGYDATKVADEFLLPALSEARARLKRRADEQAPMTVAAR